MNVVKSAGPVERTGLLQAVLRAKNQGIEIIDQSLHYSGNQGLDLIGKTADGRYAVIEAKNSFGLGSLATDKRGFRQGGKSYNIDRLNQYLDSPTATREGSALARDILGAYKNNKVDSYASFAKSDRLFKLNFETAANLRKAENAQLIQYSKNIRI